MKKIPTIDLNESGFASLVVAFILILVMSLVTVGFAQLARREQQNALDKQLSNQAYYAAESGVNEIRSQLPALTTAAQSNPSAVNPHTCLSTPYVQNGGIIDKNSDVLYTCALVNIAPPTLVSTSSSSSGSANFIFSTVGPLSQLTFSWGSADTPANNTPAPSACGIGCFPTQTYWSTLHAPAVVQLSITPLGTSGTTRTNLIGNTFTAYLYPTNGGAVKDPNVPTGCPSAAVAGNINYAADGYSDDSACNAPIVGANYDNTPGATYPFSVTVNNLGGSAGESWLVHYVYYYDSITACLESVAMTNCSSSSTSSATNFSGSEAQIDVTGKAKNVEKRIVEYVPESAASSSSGTVTQNGISTLPAYAVSAGGVCKQFATNPDAPGAGTVAATNYNTTNASADCTLGP